MDEVERDVPELEEDSGLGKYYAGLCLVALVLMVWGLNENRHNTSSLVPLVPFALGVGALFFRLPSGAPLLLATLTILIVFLGGETTVPIGPRPL